MLKRAQKGNEVWKEEVWKEEVWKEPDLKDWNKAPRSVVEEAAAEGNEGAKTALLIHQRLDRIEKSMVEITRILRGSRD